MIILTISISQIKIEVYYAPIHHYDERKYKIAFSPHRCGSSLQFLQVAQDLAAEFEEVSYIVFCRQT